MTGGNRQKSAEVSLAASLRSAEAAGLKSTIEGARGQPLRLDACNVTMIGAQCLQVLLAARATWAAQGTKFEISNLSGDMHAALGVLGVSPDQIGAREATNGA